MAGHVGSGRLRASEIAALLGGSAALAGSWVVVAASGAVPEWEADAFELVNGLPDVLWPVVWVPMQLGSIGGSLVVVALTALVSRNVRLTVAALAAEQATFWGAKVVKRLVERGRPSSLLADVDTRENLRGLGYLSGHAAIAAALATVLIPSLPRRWQWVAVAAACVVALGRLYSGAHLPLDVIGGAGFGVVCGILARRALGLGGDDEDPLHRPFAQPATAR
ncbi:MAG: phosphatase PAP2 family protein [Acidimicrobiia bacterium]|nr:phosphatase PAP2 family protein [Acidimicrobiia bacterium]